MFGKSGVVALGIASSTLNNGLGLKISPRYASLILVLTILQFIVV